MKKQALIFLFLFTTIISAQSIKVRGIIKDTIGNPLELANVIATIQSSGSIESYAISNSEGKYQLDLPKGNTYILKASFLGYENTEKVFTISEDTEDINYNFILKETTNQLDEVEIVHEMPVTIKGDTIIYNADSFNRGDEKKLGDIIKNLPGVEVNEEGEIQVQGKPVQKVMVEGKDFFDGDSKLATKNIPANAVDKVEVLRNYNEVRQLRGLGNDQDNVAINIKLKERKKNFWFGEITAGSGVDNENKERYLVHPKLFYYSPKYSLNLITDLNDIGEVPFTFRDYFNFTGGFRNFNQRGGTNFNIEDSELGFALVQNNRADAIKAAFLASNFSWSVTKKWELSGFAILSNNKTNIVTNSIRQFISTGAIENTNNNTEQRNQLGMLKLSSVYQPNTHFQLDYDALIKTSEQTEQASSLSQFGVNSNTIKEVIENNPISINQNINAYYTLNDKSVFASQVRYLWEDKDPFYGAVTDLAPFSQILPLDTLQSRFNVNQQKNVQTHKLDAKTDYYYTLNNKSNINLTLGTTLSNQQFDSNIFQLLDNGTREDLITTEPLENGLPESLINNVTYGFSDFFLGVHSKIKVDKFIITPGVTLHNYHVNNTQLGSTLTQNDWKLLPDIDIRYTIKKSENLQFNYAMIAEYTDINNFARAFVFNNYNNLFRGNRLLENALSQRYNLSYFNFNIFNNTNIVGSLSYSRRTNGFKSDSEIVAINQVTVPTNINRNFPDETFTASGRFSKRIKKIQLTTNANINFNKANNSINGTISESESFTQNYRSSLRSNFRQWPNFEVGYNIIINQYDNGGLKQLFFTQRPYINTDIRFLKHFSLSANWDFYNYTNNTGTIKNRYSFLSTSIYFQKGENPWEFSFQGTNLLNVAFTNSDNFNEQFNTTNQYFVLPRILMLVAKYNL